MNLKILYIGIIGLMVTACSATDNEERGANEEETSEAIEKGTLYVNEYGKIRLIDINDTLMQTTFENNDGFVFDTLMTIRRNFDMVESPDSLPFLQLGMSGIQLCNGHVDVYDFGGMALMGMYTKIPQVYERPFFKSGEAVTLTGKLINNGERSTFCEMISDSLFPIMDGIYKITGFVNRQQIDSTSSNDGSNSKFYALHFQAEVIEDKISDLFQGYPINLANGKAAIAWEFADSEAYILDGHQPWTNEELERPITVTGNHEHTEDGTYIRNWEVFFE